MNLMLDPAPPSGVLQDASAVAAWTEARVAVAERLWGKGFISPGGSIEILEHTKPMTLPPDSVVMMLGAEAGGPAITLASRYGVRVAAFAQDAALVAIATVRAAQAKLATRILTRLWPAGPPVFAPRSAHHMVALEPAQGQPMLPLLTACAEALRPSGHMVMTELVTGPAFDRADKAIALWSRLAGRPPSVPAEGEISKALGRLGFGLRAVEDISAQHQRLGLMGWRALMRTLPEQTGNLAPPEVILREGELWTRRLDLLRDGKLRLLRWHAVGGR
jgi:hypothetical protein